MLMRLARHRILQPFWRRLHRISLIGMNYWASEFDATGERDALKLVAKFLHPVNSPVIFDVGANVGDFSLACLEALGSSCSIYSFEPSRSTYDLLSGHVTDTSIKLHRLGFSNIEGHAVLHSSEPGSSIASLEPLDNPVRMFKPELDERVSITTIDRFCETHGIGTIDFLKLDIEGHEMKALQGARQTISNGRLRIVQFEFGENSISARSYLADIVKLLDGFDFYRIVPGGLVPWVYKDGADEIFATMNYLAVRTDATATTLSLL